jgi:ribosome-associated translation inhibitor RaiA
MQTPLQITFHDLPPSDAIAQHVRTHAAKLEALAPRIMRCRVALERPHRHSRHGSHYRVAIAVSLPEGPVVATRSPDGAKTYEDLYAVIDASFDDIGRRIQDFVRRQRGDVKTHEHSHNKT